MPWRWSKTHGEGQRFATGQFGAVYIDFNLLS